MLMLDDMEYEVKTPDENLDDVITYVNDYCQSHNIKNSVGETIFIEANEANPLYQMFRGFSYLTTAMQKLIYSAGCGMSIAEASERQLLNLADIAGIKRAQATRTVIAGTVYANLEGPDSVECIITPDMTATITIAGEEVTFHPAFDVVVPIGESRSIILIAEQYGAFSISANTITQFDDPVPGLRNLVTMPSTPGQSLESIATLRNRMQRRVVEGTQVERAETAIQGLEGISMCSIFFNYNPWESVTLPYGDTSVTVPPRQCLLMVQGYSVDDPTAIARTFYRYMLCKTTDGGLPATDVQEQTYTTHSHQELKVKFVQPKQQPVYIRIYIKNTLSFEQVNGIKDVICSLASVMIIGKGLSSVDVINQVASIYTNLTIQGAEISTSGDDGTYSYVQLPDQTALFYFDVDNIDVVQVEVAAQ